MLLPTELRKRVGIFQHEKSPTLPPKGQISAHHAHLDMPILFLVEQENSVSSLEKDETPDEGLEPSTTRLKVWRSTD
jgi:hypothetical protein